MNERIRKILEYCKGEILDIGCLQHSIDKISSKNWLHGILCKKFGFNNVVGIDISDEVLKLRELGYNVYKANAEDFNLNKKFDTVIAGELIEHLSNPGKFLECVKRHLKKDGLLILTTPNPFWIEYWIRLIFKKLKINEEHTAWFDLTVLRQLASRYGFEVVDSDYIIETYKPKTIIGFIWHKLLNPILKRILPREVLGEKIFVVLRVKDEDHENTIQKSNIEEINQSSDPS